MKLFKQYWWILVFFVMTIVVFRKFFFQGLLPMPIDLLAAAYYPWLDHRQEWGYTGSIPFKNYLPSDVISIIYPGRIVGIEQLKQGILPLWNQTILLGEPLLANFQNALLNPLNIFFFILPNWLAWSLQVVIQPLLIMMAMYFYLKNLGLQKIASTFGAIVYAFCGFSVVWMEYNTIGHTLLYFPLVLLLTDKISQQPKALFAFLLALCLSLQLFSGYPQVTIYTLYIAGIYFLYRLYYSPKEYFLKAITFSLGVLTGLLFAAIQLVPSLELISHSIRSMDTTALAGGIQFVPFSYLITLLIPDFFGNPGTVNYWASGSYDNFSFTIPTIALFFVIMALITRSIFTKRYFIYLFLILFCLILATKNPVSNFVIHSSLFGLKGAVAARIMFVFDFCLAVISAIEINNFLSKKSYSFFQKILPLAAFVGVGIGFLIVRSQFEGYERMYTSYDPHLLLPQLKIMQDQTMIAMRNTLLPLGTFGLITLLFFLKKKSLTILMAFVLLAVNITYATDKYLPFGPQKFFYPDIEEMRELKSKVGHDRFDKEQGEITPSNVWTPYGLKAASGQSALMIDSMSRYIRLVNNNEAITRFVDINNYNSPLYDTLNIHYYLAINRDKIAAPSADGTPRSEALASKFKEVKNYKSTRLYENTQNLGYAWTAHKSVCQSDQQEVARLLKDPNYNPREVMYLNCEGQKELLSTKSAEIAIQKDNPGEVILQVKSDQDSYVHMSQAYFPGWKATVDGIQTPLYTSNIALSGVFVPQGLHSVRVSYQPQSFILGAFLSLVSGLSWIGWFLFKRFK